MIRKALIGFCVIHTVATLLIITDQWVSIARQMRREAE